MKLSELDYTQIISDRRLGKLREVLKQRQSGLRVVLENIADPHNLSACLRSCDAVGVMEVCLIYDGSQPFPKLGEKSSASARKWLDYKNFSSVGSCFEYLHSQGSKIYTTHMSSSARSLYELNLTEEVALMFGNEHAGISSEALEKADGNFLIPQVGMIQSLNISVACAVSLYETFRQRQTAGMYEKTSLTEYEFNEKLKDWAAR
ncbi:MAG: TrmH family RNA methyltransferase [Candidatus Kapaibacterium sp.]|jgi:tRNA (guanosine-2'-O-)-methyltransferase|nr:TrmH family RNA methyltransferase [Candidatus Kapabacteria bacterium]